MATSSFNRDFKVTDPDAIQMLLEEPASDMRITIKRRDIEAESKKGARKLARHLLQATRQSD